MEENKNKIEGEFKKEQETDNFESEIEGFKLEEQVAEQIIQRAGYVIEQENNPERKEKMKERLAKYARRIFGITSLAALALTINHVATHDNDIEKISDGKKTEYIHSDEETNVVLNFITGKEDLTYKQKENIIKTKVKYAAQDAIEGYDIDNMTLDEMDEKIFTTNGIGMRDEYGEKWVDSIFANPPKINKEQYDAIWEILEETGKPNVHWDLKSKEARAHYDPLTHTIYVTPILFGENRNFLEREYLAELSHSKQFSEKPIASYLKVVKSGFNMLGKFILRGGSDSFESIQMEEYGEEGSLEHEAHAKIETKLKKKFEDTINSNSID